MSTTPSTKITYCPSLLNAPIRGLKLLMIPKGEYKPKCARKLCMSSPLHKKYKRSDTDKIEEMMREFSWDDVEVSR